jgi:hypothetical protein
LTRKPVLILEILKVVVVLGSFSCIVYTGIPELL